MSAGRHFKFALNSDRIAHVKISATIIAFNEEAKIEKALKSVAWADERIVVDSGSTDRTVEIASDLGAKVMHRQWTGFSDQKQFAAESSANDRIFSLDADEVVSEVLREEILGLSSSFADGYTVPRLSFYMGRPIRHGGWYPDRQLRFYDRRRGRWNGRKIHESVEMDPTATVAKLKGDLLHFSVDSILHHHEMIGTRYAPLGAEQMLAEGRRATPISLLTAGPAAFLRSYFLKLGVLDGLPGFTIARFAAQHAFLKHLRLMELQREAGRTPGENNLPDA